MGEWRCKSRGSEYPCCGDCWHPQEHRARETHHYAPAGERVEHADWLVHVLATLPDPVRIAYALRHGGIHLPLQQARDRDWYRVASRIVQLNWRECATLGMVALELGIATSTAHAYVKRAEKAVANAWI